MWFITGSHGRGGSGVRISDPCTWHQQLILPKMKLNGRFFSISALFPRLRRARVFYPTKLGPPLSRLHRGCCRTRAAHGGWKSRPRDATCTALLDTTTAPLCSYSMYSHSPHCKGGFQCTRITPPAVSYGSARTVPPSRSTGRPFAPLGSR